MTARAAASAFVFTASLLWSATVKAQPGFPDVVQRVLTLSYTPKCSLCHVNPSGSGPLGNFGTLLVRSYGLSTNMAAEDDGSLTAALQALEAGPYARLATDIQQGLDPNADFGSNASANGDSNEDGGAALSAIPLDPIPQYGCAIVPAEGAARSEGPAVLLAVGAWLLVARRGRHRNSFARRRCRSFIRTWCSQQLRLERKPP